MGQYWFPVNLTKKEFVHPHKLGSGLKLWEMLANKGVGEALIILCAAMPEPRGGGDLEENPIIGRWAGDCIAIVGDYAEDTDLPLEYHASNIFEECHNGEYEDITDLVVPVIERELDLKFTGYGWKSRHPVDK